MQCQSEGREDHEICSNYQRGKAANNNRSAGDSNSIIPSDLSDHSKNHSFKSGKLGQKSNKCLDPEEKKLAVIGNAFA